MTSMLVILHIIGHHVIEKIEYHDICFLPLPIHHATHPRGISWKIPSNIWGLW